MNCIVLLGFNVFLVLGYIECRNIMVLILTSVKLLRFLDINRKAVKEGNATAKFSN